MGEKLFINRSAAKKRLSLLALSQGLPGLFIENTPIKVIESIAWVVH